MNKIFKYPDNVFSRTEEGLKLEKDIKELIKDFDEEEAKSLLYMISFEIDQIIIK